MLLGELADKWTHEFQTMMVLLMVLGDEHCSAEDASTISKDRAKHLRPNRRVEHPRSKCSESALFQSRDIADATSEHHGIGIEDVDDDSECLAKFVDHKLDSLCGDFVGFHSRGNLA